MQPLLLLFVYWATDVIVNTAFFPFIASFRSLSNWCRHLYILTLSLASVRSLTIWCRKVYNLALSFASFCSSTHWGRVVCTALYPPRRFSFITTVIPSCHSSLAFKSNDRLLKEGLSVIWLVGRSVVLLVSLWLIYQGDQLQVSKIYGSFIRPHYKFINQLIWFIINPLIWFPLPPWPDPHVAGTKADPRYKNP